MKQLIIGIDGGTAKIFDHFYMPFWKSLRHSSILYDIKEDLNHRGWAKMLSGKGAEQTGAIYMRPNSDLSFNFKYNYTMLSETNGFKPIWEFAADANHAIGLMNIPTTFPAQPVDGFYVAGGGGGIFQGGIPNGAVYPDDSSDALKRNKYIFDTRLGAQNKEFVDIKHFCNHLSQMMQSRTKAFIELAKNHQIEFGFIAYRATTSFLFLAMSEVERVMRVVNDSWLKSNQMEDCWPQLIADHLKLLDECLEELFNELQPQNFIITSDHSIVPWTHNIDYNGFLAENNFAHFLRTPVYATKQIIKLVLQSRSRQELSAVPMNKAVQSLLCSGGRISSQSKAFSGKYVYGIYINDKDRFGGPVPALDVKGTVDEIIDTFNCRTFSDGINMTAVPYRQNYLQTPFYDSLPDVFIEQDGNAFPTTLGPHWYSKNYNFAPVNSLRGCGGMHSGQKGTKPILMVNPELGALKKDDDPLDLRLVYRLTKHLFSNT